MFLPTATAWNVLSAIPRPLLFQPYALRFVSLLSMVNFASPIGRWVLALIVAKRQQPSNCCFVGTPS